RRKIVTYLGHNVWWLPNILLWLVVWVPSWYVPDETFRTEIELEAVLVDLARNREVLRGPCRGSQTLRLNDFQRGWHLWGVISGAVYESNFEEAGEEIEPLALNLAKADLYVRLAKAAPRLASLRSKPERGPTVEKGGKRAAVIVGVDHPKAMEKGLTFASSDALRFSKSLLSTEGGWKESDITLLIDEQATRAAISRHLNPGDGAPERIVFYFAGFGAGRAGEAYIVPYDGDPEDPKATCLSLETLVAALRSKEVRTSVLILDAGFSVGGSRSVVREPLPSRPGETLSSWQGEGFSAYLAGGFVGEALEAQAFEGGLFTGSLLRAMAGSGDGNQDGKPTVEEFDSYLAREVPAKAMSLAVEQVPRVIGKGRCNWFRGKRAK
ncbi:MAG: caspase family protein, partial [Planctomycetota bacterium]